MSVAHKFVVDGCKAAIHQAAIGRILLHSCQTRVLTEIYTSSPGTLSTLTAIPHCFIKRFYHVL
jgi:hypothetical protein